MNKLGIDPEEIDIVVLSYIQGVHVGGLYRFLEENRNVFLSRFRKVLKRM